MGTIERADEFFSQWFAAALAIGDPQEILYRAFDITNGSVGQFLRPSVWKAYWSNRSFGVGAPSENTMKNPGSVLVQNSQILYQQSAAEHFGVQVDTEAVKARLLESA